MVTTIITYDDIADNCFNKLKANVSIDLTVGDTIEDDTWSLLYENKFFHVPAADNIIVGMMPKSSIDTELFYLHGYITTTVSNGITELKFKHGYSLYQNNVIQMWAKGRLPSIITDDMRHLINACLHDEIQF